MRAGSKPPPLDGPFSNEPSSPFGAAVEFDEASAELFDGGRTVETPVASLPSLGALDEDRTLLEVPRTDDTALNDASSRAIFGEEQTLLQIAESPSPFEDGETMRRAAKRELGIRLEIESRSRLEWSASALVPESGEHRYHVQLTLELPAELYSEHDRWDEVDSHTRLESSTEEGPVSLNLSDVGALRRDTVGVANRLSVLRRKFERACLAGAWLRRDTTDWLAPTLREILGQATFLVGQLRRQLNRPGAAPSVPVQEEIARVQEYISNQLLEFLSAAEQALDASGGAPVGKVPERVAKAASSELAERERLGLPDAHGHSGDVSRFVERSATLTRHFQDALLLDQQVNVVARSVRDWTRELGAAFTGTCWLLFTWVAPIGTQGRARVGLGSVVVVFACAFLLKERLKEISRRWLAGRLTRVYGQRAAVVRLPSALDAARPVLLNIREFIDHELKSGRSDGNTGVGRRSVRLRHRVQAVASAQPQLRRAGVPSLRHVLRYDVTPLASRLDSTTQRVPLMDKHTRRVRYVEVPKEYRFPVTLEIVSGERRVTIERRLVLSHRGIERIEE